MDKNQTFNGGGTVIQKFNETTFRSKLIELSLFKIVSDNLPGSASMLPELA